MSGNPELVERAQKEAEERKLKAQAEKMGMCIVCVECSPS